MLLNYGVQKTVESPLDCKEIKPVHCKGNKFWKFIGRTDTEAETPILWPPDAKNWLIVKDLDAGKGWKREEKGMTEDEMVGWHPQLNGHEFEQALGDGEGQGILVCSMESQSRTWMATEQQQQSRRGYSQCARVRIDFILWFTPVSWGHEEPDTTERLHLHSSLSCIGEGNGNSLQCSCLENPRDGGAWWAAVYGVTQSRTQLKELSSSSSYFNKIFKNCFRKSEETNVDQYSLVLLKCTNKNLNHQPFWLILNQAEPSYALA